MKNIALVAFGLLLGLILAVFALEIWLRAQKAGELEPVFHQGLNNVPVNRCRPSANIMLGWENDPNYYDGNSAGYKINKLGFADKEYDLIKASGTYRIVVLGDSITEQGWYVKQLEELLNLRNDGLKYEVFNCGVGGYSVTQYYYYLRDTALSFDPDMVILGFCLNDFTDMPVVSRDRDGKYLAFRNPLSGYADNEPVVAINKTLFFNSYLYRYAVLFLKEHFSNRNSANDPYNMALSAETLNKIRGLTEPNNIKLAAAIIPYLVERYDEPKAGEYSRMKAILFQSGLPFIDLHGIFPDIESPKWRANPGDHIHPSEEGHGIMARKIYEFLVNGGHL